LLRLAGNFPSPVPHYYYMMSSSVRRVLLALALALVGLGLLIPAARADGDPGSDVLVYQNLFIAADAGVSVPQQEALGNLLTAAGKDGFPIRVAVIAQRDDLGAITALWQQPAAYARFLGVELSLAYAQRLLVVMPDGFGFNWAGHSATAADQVLGRLSVGRGAGGLVSATKTAVRALAAASGVQVQVPAARAASSASAGAGSGPARGAHRLPAASSGFPVWLVSVIAAALVAAAGLGFRAARRAGFRPRLRLPRVKVPGTWLAGGFVALTVVALIVYVVVQPSSAPPAASAATSGALASNANLDPGATLSGPAPGFTLTDQFGQPVSLSSYRGKAVLLAFNDSECTTVCPLTTAALVEARAMLGQAGSQVQLLGIDANPKANSIEDVASYSQLHGMTNQWRYLTGTLPQLRSVWKAYSVGVTISEKTVDHEPAIFVITPEGKLAKLYLTQMAYSAVTQLGQLLASEVARVLPGHPAVDSHLSYAQAGAITPAAGASLPSASGGYVSLGPGQPRLYLFFATWTQEVTSLSGQLDALNAYQSALRRTGLPPLTAVDEGGLEPSATALTSFLGGLRQPLSYPVAIDESGRVADGYGVQGQPWFALTSASGQVLWSWEVTVSGWPSLSSLEQHVKEDIQHDRT
jgi:cytochrome oxidase Cu insertion factor (SCO1/SenC/PrrC family)